MDDAFIPTTQVTSDLQCYRQNCNIDIKMVSIPWVFIMYVYNLTA